MLCVSKTLLCALAARVGLAVRQNVKVEKTGTLANVVEKIGALIQAKGESAAHSKAIDSIRMLAAITPEANELLTESLTKVIEEIELNVDAKIMSGFKATQGAIVTTMDNLDSATTSALDKKTAADEADTTWLECVGLEQSKLSAVEGAVTEKNAADEATVVPCQQQTNRKMFKSDPNGEPNVAANPLRFECDFSIEGDCTEKEGKYAEMVSGIVSKLQKDALEATASWTEAKTACDAAVADADAKEKAREEADKAWLAKRSECKEKHTDRQLGLCTFGSALQSQCQKVGLYKALIDEVDKVDGGEHSEGDRELEWKTTQVTKCMLKKVIAGVDLDAKALSDCDSAAAVDYAGSVGKLDREAGRFTELTKHFSCAAEQTITFKGETWAVPGADEPAPTSSMYVKSHFSPKVDLDENSTPFTFC